MEETGLITRDYVNTVIKERPEEIHKGQCGKVLVIAGSKGMAGAAILTARGAVKSGAGLVKIAIPEVLFPILQTAVPQATCIDVNDLNKESVFKGLSQGRPTGYGAVAAGPGLGVDEDKYLLIKKFLEEYDGTVVLDADGINCVSKYDKGLCCLCERDEPLVLTPHVGEGDRLLSALGESSIQEIGRQKAAEIISERTGAVILMKGPKTVVAAKGMDAAGTPYRNKTYTNTTGNPGMAAGGSGDVLTGVIAAFAAYGMNPVDAAMAGAFIHGLAGDIAAEEYGQWGMSSVEIAESLPAALKQIVGK